MKNKEYKNKKNTNKFCYISDNSILVSVVVDENEDDEVDQLMKKYKSFPLTEFF